MDQCEAVFKSVCLAEPIAREEPFVRTAYNIYVGDLRHPYTDPAKDIMLAEIKMIGDEQMDLRSAELKAR